MGDEEKDEGQEQEQGPIREGSDQVAGDPRGNAIEGGAAPSIGGGVASSGTPAGEDVPEPGEGQGPGQGEGAREGKSSQE
jgi:hypothetical protein